MFRVLPIAILLLACSGVYTAGFQNQTPVSIAGIVDPPELTGSANESEPDSEPEKMLAMHEAKDNASFLKVLDGVLHQYPKYADGYSQRAFLHCYEAGSIPPEVLDDLKNAINYSTPTRSTKRSIPVAELYAMKAKVEFTDRAYSTSIDDLLSAIQLDPVGKVFDSHVSPLPPKPTSPPCEWNTTDLDALIKALPRDYRVYLFRALYYDFNAFWHHGDAETKYRARALADAEKAINTNPKSGFAYYILGSIIEHSVPLKEVVSQSPAPTENDRKILSAYDKAIAIDPKLVFAYAARANVHSYLHQYSQALTDYTKAIELQPENTDFYNFRAQLFTALKKYGDALTDFTFAIDASPPSANQEVMYELRGNVNKILGHYEDAIKDYSYAIRQILEVQVPYFLRLKTFKAIYTEYGGISDHELCNKIKQVLRPSSDYQEFAKVFTDDTDHPGTDEYRLASLYFRRADAYWQARKYRTAVRDYQRALFGLQEYTEKHPQEFYRWKLLRRSGYTEEYVDVRTVELSESTLKFWLKTVEDVEHKSSESRLSAFQIDCRAHKINVTSMTRYDVKGNVVTTADSAAWRDVIPDTLGERVYEAFCRQ
jgi:tetratricopeptide (TPR) repeat protein